ncbi:MAG TPA: cellulase, partial [Cupriavidus sp.]|nr:cellulase [Cupriavidus sp.]
MRRAMAWLLRATVVCTLAGTVLTSAAATCAWPDWDAFRRSTISQDGRVIDD